MALAKKYRKLIAEEWLDSDGYWIGLVDGYMDNGNPHCHQIHEDTRAEAYEVLKSVVRCTCPEHRPRPSGANPGGLFIHDGYDGTI